MFCDEFHLVDLRVFDNCKKVATNVDHVFNLAADMGGMGFIQSNHSVIFYNNTMISFNMMEAARQTNVKRCAHMPGWGPVYPSQNHLGRGLKGNTMGLGMPSRMKTHGLKSYSGLSVAIARVLVL